MKSYANMGEFAEEYKVPLSNIESTFKSYNDTAEKQAKDPDNGPYEAYGGGKSWDQWGKKFFHNGPLDVSDAFHVGIVTPVIHYTMGGLKMNPDAEILGEGDKAIGGVHGSNRLGGNSLLDCVVFGRVSGRSAARFLTSENIKYVEKAKGGAAAASK